MKTGRNINELAIELDRQNSNKLDFIKPFTGLEFHSVDKQGLPALELLMGIEGKDKDGNLFQFEGGLTHYAHRRLGGELNIPYQYYDRMAQFPELLKFNIEYWIKKNKTKEVRLIRTLDSKVRAILSDKYRRLDNYQLFNKVMPFLMEAGATIESCEVTPNRLYIKAVLHRVQGEIKVGEPVSMGVIIQNSEIGECSLSVKPFLMFLACTNGMVVDKLATRKYHVQRAVRGDFSSGFTFSNETLTLEDEVFWRKTKEVVKQTLSETTLNNCLEMIKGSTEVKIEDPMKAVEVLQKTEGVTEEESNNIIKHLAEGGDLTAWGLGNAVTRTAQDLESYDRATHFEMLGFKIMTSWN